MSLWPLTHIGGCALTVFMLDTTTMLVPTTVTKTLGQSAGGSAQVSTKTIIQGGTTVVTQVPVTQTLTQVLTSTIIGTGNGGGISTSGPFTASTTQGSGANTASQGVTAETVRGGYTTVTAQEGTASQAAQITGTISNQQASASGTGW